MIDTSHLTPPEQAGLVRTPPATLLEARPGDRYLLCSDGLTTVVPVAVIRETLAAPVLSLAEVVQRLITLANEAGGEAAPVGDDPRPGDFPSVPTISSGVLSGLSNVN